MVTKILADTSILIGLQRANKPIIDLFSKHQKHIRVSRITALELLYGSRNNKEKKVNKDFIDKLNIVEVNPEISLLSYKLIDKYGLKTRFGIADSLIVATAVSRKLSLWTENTKHFKSIKEVSIFEH